MTIFRQALLKLCLSAALATTIMGAPAIAEDYFAGKTIDVHVPSGGGSGLDVMARAVIDVWKEHIPGSPTVIVRNQDDGRGGKVLNDLYDRARPDGLTISFGSWIPMKVLAQAPGVRHVPEEMGLVGAFSTWSVLFARTDLGPGLKTSTDVANLEESFSFGGRFAESTSDILGLMTLDMMGIDYKFISGYRGASRIIPAVLANEIQMGSGSYSTHQRIVQYIESGDMISLWNHARFDENGTPMTTNAIPGVPTFTDVYKEVHGEFPSGITYEAYRWYVNTVLATGLVMLTPPGTPENVLADLRTAYEGLIADPKFKEVQDTRGVSLAPVSLERGENIIKNFREIPPGVEDELKRLSMKGTG